MVVPSLRRRVGAIEINNKLIKDREEKKKKEEFEKKEIISEEEHKRRLEILKRIWILKG